MRPLLAAVELPQVQEIRVGDVRSVAEHKPPGKDGSLLQDLGRVPTRVTVWGVATDPDAPALVERLKSEMRAGAPVPFVADITTDTQIEDVLIDDVQVRQLAGRPDRYAYVIVLREHVEPAVPQDTSAVDADILGEVTDLLDDLVGGLDLAAGFAAGLERFVQPLGDLLERLTAFGDQVDAARN
ncbi:MAG TPA: hypothetical protein VHF25_12165 [Nitriliruptorales bacterium]|nr:hypothetical protein [Nitriliruptorales bacterium]